MNLDSVIRSLENLSSVAYSPSSFSAMERQNVIVEATKPLAELRAQRDLEAAPVKVVERHIDYGTRLARQLFARRERGSQKRSEIHIGEAELAAALALAYEAGTKSR